MSCKATVRRQRKGAYERSFILHCILNLIICVFEEFLLTTCWAYIGSCRCTRPGAEAGSKLRKSRSESILDLNCARLASETHAEGTRKRVADIKFAVTASM